MSVSHVNKPLVLAFFLRIRSCVLSLAPHPLLRRVNCCDLQIVVNHVHFGIKAAQVENCIPRDAAPLVSLAVFLVVAV